MSLKKVEQIKKDKGFKLWDILIYAIIALLVVGIFLAVFFTKDKDPLTGIKIKVGSEVVYAYSFEKGGRTEINTDKVEEVISGDIVTVKITAVGHNTVEINTKTKTVKMSEADCSRFSKDCVHTPAIKDNNGMIVCQPNNVVIIPFANDIDVII